MIESMWTNSEKKLARKVFDAAVERELSQLVEEFKRKAAATSDVETLWQVRDWMNRRQREIDNEFDFRYSQLIFVFARLVRTRKIEIAELNGLSEQKLAEIQFIAER